MISKQKDDDGAKKEVFIHATVYRQIYDEKKKTFVIVNAMKF